MRSVVVVLPASMCAEIPMFRYRSMGVFLAIAFTSSESEMSKSPVGLGHPVHFFALLHRAAAPLRSLDQLARQTQRHRFLAALLGGLAQPSHRQRHPAHRPHFDRYLIVGAADPAALDLDRRPDVAQSLGEDLD